MRRGGSPAVLILQGGVHRRFQRLDRRGCLRRVLPRSVCFFRRAAFARWCGAARLPGVLSVSAVAAFPRFVCGSRAAFRGGFPGGFALHLLQPLLRPVKRRQRVRLVPAVRQVFFQVARKLSQLAFLFFGQVFLVGLRGQVNLPDPVLNGFLQGFLLFRRPVRLCPDHQQPRQRHAAAQCRGQRPLPPLRADQLRIHFPQSPARVPPLQQADFAVVPAVFKRGHRPLLQSAPVRRFRRRPAVHRAQRVSGREQRRERGHRQRRPQPLIRQRHKQRHYPRQQRRREAGRQPPRGAAHKAVAFQPCLHRADRLSQFIVHFPYLLFSPARL